MRRICSQYWARITYTYQYGSRLVPDGLKIWPLIERLMMK